VIQHNDKHTTFKLGDRVIFYYKQSALSAVRKLATDRGDDRIKWRVASSTPDDKVLIVGLDKVPRNQIRKVLETLFSAFTGLRLVYIETRNDSDIFEVQAFNWEIGS
jgi:hypothetical protein